MKDKITTKEEPKQENCCTPIGQIKRYVDCKGCDRKPKQETLENPEQGVLWIGKNNHSDGIIRIKQEESERSYSEEDMIEFGEWMKILPLTISGFVVKTETKSIVVGKTKELLQIWFEQFKKK